MSTLLPIRDLNLILEHTLPLWKQARGKSFFITGGTGYIGRWLLDSLLHIDHELDLKLSINVLTRRDPATIEANLPAHRWGHLTFLRGDVRTFDFPPGRFDYIVHGAAEPSTTASDRDVHNALAEGTDRVLRFALHAGTEQILYLSSGAVYGPPSGPVAETDECFPATGYGWGKYTSERMCTQRHTKAKIARIFTICGPHEPLDMRYAFDNFLADTIHGRPIGVSNGGLAVRSWLYTADLATWLWTILFAGQPGRAYNVGSPTYRSVLELAYHFGEVDILPPSAGDRPQFYVPDVTRCHDELGLQAWTTLPEAIQRTLAWSRQYAESVLPPSPQPQAGDEPRRSLGEGGLTVSPSP